MPHFGVCFMEFGINFFRYNFCYPELSKTLTNIYQNRLFQKVGKTQKDWFTAGVTSHLSIRTRSTHVLPYRHFMATVYFLGHLDGDSPYPLMDRHFCRLLVPPTGVHSTCFNIIQMSDCKTKWMLN